MFIICAFVLSSSVKLRFHSHSSISCIHWTFRWHRINLCFLMGIIWWYIFLWWSPIIFVTVVVSLSTLSKCWVHHITDFLFGRSLQLCLQYPHLWQHPFQFYNKEQGMRPRQGCTERERESESERIRPRQGRRGGERDWERDGLFPTQRKNNLLSLS